MRRKDDGSGDATHLLASGISAEFARSLMPLGAKLSKDAPDSRRLGVYKPHGSISRSWPLYREKNSLTLVLQQVWRWHEMSTGRPWPEIFDGDCVDTKVLRAEGMA